MYDFNVNNKKGTKFRLFFKFFNGFQWRRKRFFLTGNQDKTWPEVCTVISNGADAGVICFNHFVTFPAFDER